MPLAISQSFSRKNRLSSLAALLWVAAATLTACGGGSQQDPSVPGSIRLVGEVLSGPEQIATTDFKVTAGYSGQPDTARALQRLGHAPLVDMLFMLPNANDTTLATYTIRPDAEERLLAFLTTHRDLLQPGVRVLIKDEVYWNPSGSADTTEVLQPQLEALKRAVGLVRRHAPQLSVGITVTPYGSLGRPVTLDYIGRAIALVDWVGTDPYWFGDMSAVSDLNAWTRSFTDLARAAHPKVETWLIAQAFKDPAWNVTVFNDLIRTQLTHAKQYDHVIFFGWQFVSELPVSFAGKYFSAETKAVYGEFLKR